MASGAWVTRGSGPVNPQELNRYSYALNNPVRYTDPTGHCIFALADTAVCAAVASTAAGSGAAAGSIAAAAGPPGWFIAGAVVIGVGIIAMSSDSPDETVGSVGGAEGLAPSLPDTASESAAESPLPRGGTYVLKDPVTGEIVRSGRTNDLQRRRAEHARDPNLADTEFDVDARTDDYAAQRGREQYLHEKYQPKYNHVRGVDPRNPKRERYERAGKEIKGKY